MSLRRGVTLPELLIALLLVSLLAAFGFGTFDSLVARERTTAGLNRILGAVHEARTLAVTRQARVTLCPGDSTTLPASCAGRDQWHRGWMIYIDHNGNGHLDDDRELLKRHSGWSNGARVRWRSFRNRSQLHFRANGMTDWQNGSFTWCPGNGDIRFAAQLVLNAGGRSRVARDRDGDGVVEDSQGRPLRC